MNSKFISFVLSILILSIALSAVAHPAIHKYKDSSELFKRHYEKNDTCPCVAAVAEFSDEIWGSVTFSQNEDGETLVAGIFSDGLPNPEKICYEYLIIDACDKVLYNLTSALDIKYRKNGTWPFSVRLDDLILDCDSKGVLLVDSECKCDNDTTYHKRADTGAPYLEVRPGTKSSLEGK
jgi:hypothetical protein